MNGFRNSSFGFQEKRFKKPYFSMKSKYYFLTKKTLSTSRFEMRRKNSRISLLFRFYNFDTIFIDDPRVAAAIRDKDNFQG